MQEQPQAQTTKILTVPNLLSMFRLVLIPIFLWTYLALEQSRVTAALIVLSFLTDVADGYIARRYGQVSDLGKALDPVADKLTQGAMLLCLTERFPVLLWPLILFAVKEFFTGITSMAAINRSGAVHGARWHGKVTTGLMYALLLVHILWPDMPQAVSTFAAILVSAMMLLSFILYSLQNLRIVRDAKHAKP